MSIINAYQQLIQFFLEKNDFEAIFLIKGHLRLMPQPLVDKVIHATIQADIGFDLTIRALARPASIFSHMNMTVYQWQELLLIHICQKQDMRGKFLFMDLLRLLGYRYELVMQMAMVSLVQKGEVGNLQYLLEQDAARYSINFKLHNGQSLVDLAIFYQQADILRLLLTHGATCNEHTVAMASVNAWLCFDVLSELRPQLCSAQRVTSWLASG